MMTGYEQVRSIAADLAGDMEAARRVELDLARDGRLQRSRGLGAGRTSCCGGPAKVDASACCAADESAKQAGAIRLRVFMNDVAQDAPGIPVDWRHRWRWAPPRRWRGHRAIICRRSWPTRSRATSACHANCHLRRLVRRAGDLGPAWSARRPAHRPVRRPSACWPSPTWSSPPACCCCRSRTGLAAMLSQPGSCSASAWAWGFTKPPSPR